MPHLQPLVTSLGPEGFYHKVCTLLNEKQLSVDDFSYYDLAEACGVLPELRSTAAFRPDLPIPALLRESNPGVNSSLFQVVTAELIGRKVLEGYEDDSGFIGDRLVTVLPSRNRQQKLAGFRALSGPTEVAEGHPYEESTFREKYITTEEAKRGRILSIQEELIAFDQTGEINRRAMAMGFYLRQERERTILRAVTDADASQQRYVYRPSGQGQPLYKADGSHQNYIGPENTTSPDFGISLPLVSYADIDTALNYRATQVKDDRIDGEPRPILVPARQILVPECLRGHTRSVVHANDVLFVSGDQETRLANPIRDQFEVLSSPFIDEQGGDALNTWYLGDFRRQFLWTEIWPVQTFLQRETSESAFERDVVLRVKARYFGGVSAVDTVFVTCINGTPE